MMSEAGVPTAMAAGWDALRQVYSDPQMQMLELVSRLGTIDAENLAEQMNTTVRARGFEENLRRLRSDGMLTGEKSALELAGWLPR